MSDFFFCDGLLCVHVCVDACITSSCFEAGLSMAPAKACRIWHLVSIKAVWRSCNSVCFRQKTIHRTFILRCHRYNTVLMWLWLWILLRSLPWKAKKMQSTPGRLWARVLWSSCGHSVAPEHNPEFLISLSGSRGCPPAALGPLVSTLETQLAGPGWASRPPWRASHRFLRSAGKISLGRFKKRKYSAKCKDYIQSVHKLQ